MRIQRFNPNNVVIEIHPLAQTSIEVVQKITQDLITTTFAASGGYEAELLDLAAGIASRLLNVAHNHGTYMFEFSDDFDDSPTLIRTIYEVLQRYPETIITR